jgi:predicted aspartyl protease
MKGGEKGETEQMLCVYETALILKAIEDGNFSDRTFIVDTGASSHMVYSKRYLTNIQEVDSNVTAGNNMTIQCTLKGDYVGYLQSEGRQSHNVSETQVSLLVETQTV